MYRCVFFDLDHTLWDYERNSKETLHEIYGEFRLIEKDVDFDKFHFRFREVNLQLWDLYDRGVIGSEVIRKERFKQILETFNVHDDKLSQQLSDSYLQICPDKGNLMPHAMETLDYLSSRYNLTVITNGFDEIQHRKLASSNVVHFFDHIITSQRAGHKKPAREIFDYALQLNNIASSQAIMVGDNLTTDMGGARNATIDTVFFNHDGVRHNDVVKHEIRLLSELQGFL
jgi:putative hydrolase of the HAD superfamily